MTECYQESLPFGRVCRREVEAQFTGGDITSNGGVMLLRQVDRKLGLSATLAKAIGDPRRQASCQHSLTSLIQQRLYCLCLGYDDVDDHDALRLDGAVQTACGSDRLLGSSSTLGRLERRASRTTAVAMHEVLVEQFIASFDSPPDSLTLDFDATDDAVHGNQVGRFFHGYYGHYCFLPLYVTCGDHLLVSYLREANQDGAKHAKAILGLLVKRLRQQWPDVQIIFRGDSGFCRHRLLRWCEWAGVDYIVGIARNKVLERRIAAQMRAAEKRYIATGEKQRDFTQLYYSAGSWDDCRRKVIAKLEYLSGGPNPRFITTSLEGDSQDLYDTLYCARGDMENRIKEQFQLFSDRTSCHHWWPNQFRLLLASAAYVLMNGLRQHGLKNTKLARAEPNTLRLKLLRIGAIVLRNTRRVKLLLSSHHPDQRIFAEAALALEGG